MFVTGMAIRLALAEFISGMGGSLVVGGVGAFVAGMAIRELIISKHSQCYSDYLGTFVNGDGSLVAWNKVKEAKVHRGKERILISSPYTLCCLVAMFGKELAAQLTK